MRAKPTGCLNIALVGEGYTLCQRTTGHPLGNLGRALALAHPAAVAGNLAMVVGLRMATGEGGMGQRGHGQEGSKSSKSSLDMGAPATDPKGTIGHNHPTISTSIYP